MQAQYYHLESSRQAVLYNPVTIAHQPALTGCVSVCLGLPGAA
jgi:hypothetical protein